jgi:Protein of unknown function (DUF3445)
MPLQLPAIAFPFPVKPDYTIRADLAKMPQDVDSHSTNHFHLDSDYFKYVQDKLQVLQTHPELCHVYANANETALTKICWRIFAQLASEYPEYVIVTKDGVRLELLELSLDKNLNLKANPSDAYAYLVKQQSLKRLVDTLALAVQEDLVILHNSEPDTSEPDTTELMQVCFPSHWNPAERIGQGLYQLHLPVASNEQLLKASRSVAQAMTNKGPFVRFVWSLNSTDELNLNPALHTQGRKKPLSSDPSKWFFRVERQTTLAFPDLQRSLFTIRIYIEPLTHTLKIPERKHMLAQAVRSMNESLLRYKGLTKVKETLLEYLQS